MLRHFFSKHGSILTQHVEYYLISSRSSVRANCPSYDLVAGCAKRVFSVGLDERQIQNLSQQIVFAEFTAIFSDSDDCGAAYQILLYYSAV